MVNVIIKEKMLMKEKVTADDGGEGKELDKGEGDEE